MPYEFSLRPALGGGAAGGVYIGAGLTGGGGGGTLRDVDDPQPLLDGAGEEPDRVGVPVGDEVPMICVGCAPPDCGGGVCTVGCEATVGCIPTVGC